MKRTALGLAGVAAVGVALTVPSMGQSQSPGERTITLKVRTTSVKLADPRARPAAGTCSWPSTPCARPMGRAPGRDT